MIPEYYVIVYIFFAMERLSKYQFQAFKALMYYHVLGFNCMYVAFYI